MSDEIKNPIDEENHQAEETAPEVSTIDNEEKDENEPPLSTPNGRESPSATSFSEVIIETKEEEPPPPPTFNDNQPLDLVQTISEKSNEEASSTILNTVR